MQPRTRSGAAGAHTVTDPECARSRPFLRDRVSPSCCTRKCCSVDPGLAVEPDRRQGWEDPQGRRSWPQPGRQPGLRRKSSYFHQATRDDSFLGFGLRQMTLGSISIITHHRMSGGFESATRSWDQGGRREAPWVPSGQVGREACTPSDRRRRIRFSHTIRGSSRSGPFSVGLSVAAGVATEKAGHRASIW